MEKAIMTLDGECKGYGSEIPIWTPDGNPPLSMILLGKTGAGKSATGNTLIGWKGFETSPYAQSETFDSKAVEGVAGGRNILAVDTQGLYDTREEIKGSEDVKLNLLEYAQKSRTCREILRSFALATTKGKDYSGINAFILVINLNSRYTEEDFNSYLILKKLFGQSFVKYTIVLFTHIDVIEEEKGMKIDNFVDWLKSNQKRVLTETQRSILEECNWRTIVFDNKAKNDNARRSNQVADLIQLIEKMQVDNGNTPFNTEELTHAKTILEDEITKRMKELKESRQVVTKIIREQVREKKGNIFSRICSAALTLVSTITEIVHIV